MLFAGEGLAGEYFCTNTIIEDMENLTRWHISFTGIESVWLRVLVLCLAISALYFSWRGIKALPLWNKQTVLFALRFLMVALFCYAVASAANRAEGGVEVKKQGRVSYRQF